MGGFNGKFGLASAVDGFSEGLKSGAAVVGGLTRIKGERIRDDRAEARLRRQDARAERFDTAQLSQMEEETAGLKQANLDKAADSSAEKWGAPIEADLLASISQFGATLPENQRMEYYAGVANAGKINMGMGDAFRGAALVLHSGSIEAMGGAPAEATNAAKQILSNAFGLDFSEVDEIRKSEDGGIEIVSNGKPVKKLDKATTMAAASGLMRKARTYYWEGMQSVREAQQAMGGNGKGAEPQPRVLDMGNGMRGVLQEGADGGKSLRAIPQFDEQGKPIPTGLSAATPSGDPNQPQFAFEFAKKAVESGTEGPALSVNVGGKPQKLRLPEIMKEAQTNPAYNDVAEEYVHSYIRDVYSRAGKAMEKKSADGTYGAADFGREVVRLMKQEGFAELLPYAQMNKDSILGQ